ncbi:non-specific lipid-transfer protein-like isoform X2 [Prosopis cineraria]|uniref:non-specific lipid-transfer protein-like isoform X2 n=1 Tax=Prosopis cineraria TaxID=364024 RepID=UPI00240F0DA1|nr:non-specific lipid-transfer protein-like isoform X2 [Prosopis cineraria]
MALLQSPKLVASDLLASWDTTFLDHSLYKHFDSHHLPLTDQSNHGNSATISKQAISTTGNFGGVLKMMGRLLMVAGCMAVVVVAVGEAITCGQVQSNLAPCLNYLKNGGGPPPACCNGVRTTVNSARTTPDRQAVCNCLKAAAGRVPGVKSQFAEALPSRCRVFIPYKISMSTNCARF